MSPAQFGSVVPGVLPSATRRNLVSLAVAGCLAGLQKTVGAAPQASAKLTDVLDKPASTARLTAASPMLRVARCAKRLVAVGERGVIVYSDDDGARWQQAKVPVSVTLTGVQFTSEKRGFVIGHSGVVLRTDDAGLTWRRMLDGRQYAALLSQPEAVRQAELEGPDKPWLSLHFTDDQNGWVVGAFGMALQTADGGQTWRSVAERLPNPRVLHLNAVQRQGQNVWIAGEQGLYLVSTDGGRSFSAPSTGYRGSFFAVCPLADGGVVLGGLRGMLLLHDQTGQFRVLSAASTQGVIGLLRLPSNALALLDQSGRLFIASVADLNFKPVAVLPERVWLAVAPTSDGHFVGTSSDGVSRLQLTLPLSKT